MRPGCSDIRDVSLSRLLAVMSSRQPHGRFLAREDTGWTALALPFPGVSILCISKATFYWHISLGK